jgi:serine/threonine protein kinase
MAELQAPEQQREEQGMAELLGSQVGRYRLTRLLGKGPAADVYLAHHVSLGMEVVIKWFRTPLTGDTDRERFFHEAHVLASLVHPAINRVFHGDVLDGSPYLVMTYAAAGSLRQCLRPVIFAPTSWIIACGMQAAEALQYAHDQQRLHCNIKPENLLLGPREEVLLADFGMIALPTHVSQHSTQGGAGSGVSIAPEQLQGNPCSASDQYALAAVLYEGLTGALPFQGSAPEAAKGRLFPPSPLQANMPTFLEDLQQVLQTALDKDPNKRFASMQAFAQALKRCQREESAGRRRFFHRMPFSEPPENWVFRSRFEEAAPGHAVEAVSKEPKAPLPPIPPSAFPLLVGSAVRGKLKQRIQVALLVRSAARRSLKQQIRVVLGVRRLRQALKQDDYQAASAEVRALGLRGIPPLCDALQQERVRRAASAALVETVSQAGMILQEVLFQALEQLGLAAVPPLMEALQQERVRRKARQVLVIILHQADECLWEAALGALEQLGSLAVVPLVDYLEGSNDPERVKAAVVVLQRLLARCASENTQTLEEALGQASNITWSRFLPLVEQLGPLAVVPLVDSIVGSDDYEQVKRAVTVLQRLLEQDASESAQALEKALASASEVRWRDLLSLLKLLGPLAVVPLAKNLRRTQEAYRIGTAVHVLQHLVEHHAAELAPEVLQLIAATDPQIQAQGGMRVWGYDRDNQFFCETHSWPVIIECSYLLYLAQQELLRRDWEGPHPSS